MYFQQKFYSSVVRYKTHNQKVPGSILTGGSIFFSCSAICFASANWPVCSAHKRTRN